MQNFYYVISCDVDSEIWKGKIAYAEKIEGGGNLLHSFPKDATVVMPCETFKRAKEIADLWNGTYRVNGTYAKAPENEAV